MNRHIKQTVSTLMEPDEVSFLETAPLIPNHAAIAVELVFNAIDAGATHMSLVVDLMRNQIRCRDDGQGIPLGVWPYILRCGHSFEKGRSKLKRDSHTLAKIRQIADVTVVTRTKSESSPRRMTAGVPQYAAPLFSSGTEVIVSAAFEKMKMKVREFGTVSARRNEVRKIKTIVSTVLLKFPEITATMDFGSSKVMMKSCESVDARWRQITGTGLILDSDGMTTRYRASNQTTFQTVFCPFMVGCFPCSMVIIDGKEVRPATGALVSFDGLFVDNIEWGVEGIEIHGTRRRSTEPRLSENPVGNDELEVMKVVGVWDSKFIICHHGTMLYAIDQHAAHERVNLEKLLDQIDRVTSTRELKDVIDVQVPITKLNLLPAVKSELRRWGWKVIQAGSSWKIHAIPVVCDVLVDDVQGMLDFVDQIESNCKPEIPECILHILQTKACRNSIKFGDIITNDTAQDLVRMLSHTHRPNHCAHGRTVAVPLHDLAKPYHKFLSV